MKKVLLFILKNCPYCKEVLRYHEELMEKYPHYRQLDIRIVDEAAEADFANAHDYYYVPTYYVDGVKVHEGAANKQIVENVFRMAGE